MQPVSRAVRVQTKFLNFNSVSFYCFPLSILVVAQAVCSSRSVCSLICHLLVQSSFGQIMQITNSNLLKDRGHSWGAASDCIGLRSRKRFKLFGLQAVGLLGLMAFGVFDLVGSFKSSQIFRKIQNSESSERRESSFLRRT